jgi:hypothetical protein
MPICYTGMAHGALEMHHSEAGPSSGMAESFLAEVDAVRQTTFIRWALEQCLRDLVEQAYLAGCIAGYKDAGGSHVPEVVIEVFRASARAVCEEPLGPGDVAFLDDMCRF